MKDADCVIIYFKYLLTRIFIVDFFLNQWKIAIGTPPTFEGTKDFNTGQTSFDLHNDETRYPETFFTFAKCKMIYKGLYLIFLCLRKGKKERFASSSFMQIIIIIGKPFK